MSGNQAPQGLMLQNVLALEYCPHYGIAKPSIAMPIQANWVRFAGHDGKERIWGVYGCSWCGRLIVAVGQAGPGSQVTEIYPVPKSVAEEIPQKPREYLRQAILTVHAPAGSVMLCAQRGGCHAEGEGSSGGHPQPTNQQSC